MCYPSLPSRQRRARSGSDYQACAAFSAAASQHFATIGRSHAGAETVDTFAFEIAGLERSFHGGNFRICGPRPPIQASRYKGRGIL